MDYKHSSEVSKYSLEPREQFKLRVQSRKFFEFAKLNKYWLLSPEDLNIHDFSTYCS